MRTSARHRCGKRGANTGHDDVLLTKGCAKVLILLRAAKPDPSPVYREMSVAGSAGRDGGHGTVAEQQEWIDTGHLNVLLVRILGMITC